jgi:hypothetical protein
MQKSFKYYLALSTLFSLLNITDLYAQVLGNEWIVSGQIYYKIPVGKSGIYAISGTELASAGLPAGTINPQKLQLWHRGVEQAILVKGEADGILDASDSLFFYGEVNDGTLDSLLYLTPALQPHKYYNLYSDTAAYFITWAANNGKRMKLVNNISSQAPDPYHLDEALTLFTDTYEMGKEYVEGHLSEFDEGEGWFSGYFNGNSSYTVNVKNLYAAGPWAKLEIQVVGRNQATATHNVTISIGNSASPDTVFILPAFSFHQIYTFRGFINPAFIPASGNLNINVSANNTTDDLISLAYIKLTYPQTTDMYNLTGKYFNLSTNTQDTSYLEISNPSLSAMVFDITSKDSVRMINPVFQSGLLKVVVPGTLSGRKLYISSAFLSASAILSANLSNYSTSSEFIIVTHTKLLNGADAYASYRASTQGGAWSTLVADVNKLYNLFTYGERTPLAIRRFARYLLNNGSPEYLFLIGKGMGVNFNQFGAYYRKNPNLFRITPDNTYGLTIDDLVPTAGYPASDILYTAGMDNVAGHEYQPAIKTGRLAVRDTPTILKYLEKVKEQESLDSNNLWRKNLIHISGGDDASQIQEFKNYVNGYKSIAEGPLFGGKVIRTFSKESTSSVDDSFKQSVAEEVNKGISYLTFFGHSSPSFTDVDLGFVSTDFLGYHNKGQYPFLFSNGCYSCNIFNYYSYMEDWIITPDRGAIVGLGHTDLGFTYLLNSYDDLFYRTAFTNPAFITKSLGAIQKEVLKTFAFGGNSLDDLSKAAALQMMIHGDPSIKIYGPSRNDYSITPPPNTNNQQLFVKSYDNEPVTAVSDSFAIGIIVSNYGQASSKDSFAVTVTRSVNNKNTIVYGPVMYPVIYYKDTIYFKIKSKDLSTYGENSFIVKVDALDSIPEMREDNNTVTFDYFIPISGVSALFPKEYSIVNSSFLTGGNQIKLIAQSTDLLLGPSDYYFEIDTSYLFNSSLKQSTTLHSGSLATWNTSLNILKDSTVYYWRARFAQIASGQDTLWGKSSFIYIAGSPEGWSQSEFAQFTKDNLSTLLLNVQGKKWDFQKSSVPIHVRSVGSAYPPNPNLANWTPTYETEVSLNNIELVSKNRFGECGQGLLAIAISKNSGIPYIPIPSPAVPIGYTCGAVTVIQDFPSMNIYSPGNGLDQSALVDYIDAVPVGDYIMLCNKGEIYGSDWNILLKDKLKTALGSRLADSIVTGRPYVILAIKGNYAIGTGPLPLVEKFNNDSSSVIMDTTVYSQANHGTITSTLIGPSTKWDKLFRSVILSDSSDKYDLKIIKIRADGTQVTDTIGPFGASYDLSTKVDSTFPYIRLVATVYDSINLTPPQLVRWQVVYRGAPEGTMNPEATNNIAQYQPLPKTEGQLTKLTFVFSNIFNMDFPDSIRVKFTITNESGHFITSYITLPPLKKDSSISFNYTINSLGFSGKNVFQAFVNPRLQPEQNYDNNIIEFPFVIEKDKTSPLIDVVFDGQHIMNGDVVSPSPLITIVMNDENKFLVKNDTLGMLVFLQRPGDQFPQRINLSDLNVTYGQESGNSNTFKIDYHPKNLPDGIYTLIVQGSDVSGNKSGAQNYRITFEVINEVAISYFYPYPNPFSTSTRFVFTLTGNEIPEDMKIQIMTVTGKVVREIMKSEIGPLRIGNNKTDYAWDGTDEYGDKLANGVYLYRVIIKGADDFKHKQTAGDKNFKKDWGKMYILR